MSLVAADVLKD